MYISIIGVTMSEFSRLKNRINHKVIKYFFLEIQEIGHEETLNLGQISIGRLVNDYAVMPSLISIHSYTDCISLRPLRH